MTHCPNRSSLYSGTDVNIVICQHLHPQIHLWHMMQTLYLLLQFHSYFTTNIRFSGQIFHTNFKNQLCRNTIIHTYEKTIWEIRHLVLGYSILLKNFYLQNEYKLVRYEYNLTSMMVEKEDFCKALHKLAYCPGCLSNLETCIPHHRSSFYAHKVCTHNLIK